MSVVGFCPWFAGWGLGAASPPSKVQCKRDTVHMQRAFGCFSFFFKFFCFCFSLQLLNLYAWTLEKKKKKHQVFGAQLSL